MHGLCTLSLQFGMLNLETFKKLLELKYGQKLGNLLYRALSKVSYKEYECMKKSRLTGKFTKCIERQELLYC